MSAGAKGVGGERAGVKGRGKAGAWQCLAKTAGSPGREGENAAETQAVALGMATALPQGGGGKAGVDLPLPGADDVEETRSEKRGL